MTPIIPLFRTVAIACKETIKVVLDKGTEIMATVVDKGTDNAKNLVNKGTDEIKTAFSILMVVVDKGIQKTADMMHKGTNKLMAAVTGSDEPRKVVLQRGFTFWAFRKYMIHLAALSVTWAVVTNNIRNAYAWDQGKLKLFTDTKALNALQFAAKLHEIVIVGSLSSIVLHHVRRKLMNAEGIPLGLLASGYQPGSVENLCSLGF